MRVVDLIDEFEGAEQRPGPGVRVPAYTIGGVTHPAIVMPLPSRITWRLPLPHDGVLRTFVARLDAAPSQAAGMPVRFRIGVADDRIYEGLTEITAMPGQSGWMALETDLSAYAGWQWSLFYRPDRIIWNVVLAADALAGGEAKAAWGGPAIVTGIEGAREYARRRASPGLPGR